MIRFIFFAIILIPLAGIGQNRMIQARFNYIMNHLDSVIMNSKKPNATVEMNYKYVRDKIKDKEILINFDSTLEYGYRNCIIAKKGDGKKTSLSFGNFLIDCYSDFPFLTQGLIIHEFQRIYDFYNNQELVSISKNNCIEETYFKIDALSLEALFLKNYAPKGTTLSPVEKYLISDLDNGLSGSSILFEKTDLELLHLMDAIKNKEITYAQGIKEFVTIGEELLKKTKFNQNSWENYCQIVSLRTYIYYSRQVVHDILFKLDHKNVSDKDLDLKNYPDVYQILSKVLDLFKANTKYLSYNDETLEKFDTYIKTQMLKSVN